MTDRRLFEEPRLLNPFDELIVVPVWLIILLKKRKLLFWNRTRKRYQISSNVYLTLFIESQSSGFVHKPLRAINLEHAGGRPKDSGRVNPIIQALGRDCRGLNVSTAETRRLASNYQEPNSSAARELRAEQVVKEVMSARSTS